MDLQTSLMHKQDRPETLTPSDACSRHNVGKKCELLPSPDWFPLQAHCASSLLSAAAGRQEESEHTNEYLPEGEKTFHTPRVQWKQTYRYYAGRWHLLGPLFLGGVLEGHDLHLLRPPDGWTWVRHHIFNKKLATRYVLCESYYQWSKLKLLKAERAMLPTCLLRSHVVCLRLMLHGFVFSNAAMISWRILLFLISFLLLVFLGFELLFCCLSIPCKKKSSQI